MRLLPNSIILYKITDAKIHFADHYPIRSLKEFHLIFEMTKYLFREKSISAASCENTYCRFQGLNEFHRSHFR